jgi:hypothetical protein
MFIYGTEGTTLRAWPLHSIKSLSFHPKGSGPEHPGPELAIHLTDGSIAWLRGAEAEVVWKQICAQGIGHLGR